MSQGAENKEYIVELLGPLHDRAGFHCGVPALDAYFWRQARQDSERNLATVFVLSSDGKTVAGFYTLSSSSVLNEDLPKHLAKKLPRFPIPVTLLGRMAVSSTLRGQGLGEFLLMLALERALLGSREVASWAVIVDAKQGAREFCLKYDFLPFPTQPDRLFLPMRDIEKFPF